MIIQFVIGFFNLFKGFLVQNSQKASARARLQNRKLEQRIKGNLHQIQVQFGLGFQTAHQLVFFA